MVSSALVREAPDGRGGGEDNEVGSSSLLSFPSTLKIEEGGIWEFPGCFWAPLAFFVGPYGLRALMGIRGVGVYRDWRLPRLLREGVPSGPEADTSVKLKVDFEAEEGQAFTYRCSARPSLSFSRPGRN